MHMDEQNNVDIANTAGSIGANLVINPDSETALGEQQRLVSKLCSSNFGI